MAAPAAGVFDGRGDSKKAWQLPSPGTNPQLASGPELGELPFQGAPPASLVVSVHSAVCRTWDWRLYCAASWLASSCVMPTRLPSLYLHSSGLVLHRSNSAGLVVYLKYAFGLGIIVGFSGLMANAFAL